MHLQSCRQTACSTHNSSAHSSAPTPLTHNPARKPHVAPPPRLHLCAVEGVHHRRVLCASAEQGNCRAAARGEGRVSPRALPVRGEGGGAGGRQGAGRGQAGGREETGRRGGGEGAERGQATQEPAGHPPHGSNSCSATNVSHSLVTPVPCPCSPSNTTEMRWRSCRGLSDCGGWKGSWDGQGHARRKSRAVV